MITTPATCHQTETSLSNATRRTLKTLTSREQTRITRVDVDHFVRRARERAAGQSSCSSESAKIAEP